MADAVLTRVRVRALALALSSCLVFGCGDDVEGEPGLLSVRVSGGEAVETMIPASVSDGWVITFDRYLVAVSGLTVSRGSNSAVIADTPSTIVDLAQGSAGQGHVILDMDVVSTSYDRAALTLADSSQDPANANADGDDIRLMAQNRFSVFVEGEAKQGGTVKSFQLGFRGETRASGCSVGPVTVTPTGVAFLRLNLRADQLFGDDLATVAGRPTFSPLAAADANSDGRVTEAELRAATNLDDYRLDGAALTTLWDVLQAQAGRIAIALGDSTCATVE